MRNTFSNVGFRTIGQKLVALVLSALAVSALFTATLVGWTDAQRQTAAETDRLTRTAAVIGSLAAESVRAEDRTGAFAALRSISQMPEVTYGRIQMRDGRLLAETGGGVRLASDVTASEGARISVWSVMNTGTIEVEAPVVSQGEPVGSITLLAKAPGVHERVLASVGVTILGVALAATGGLLIALWLGRRISGPIVRLAAFVKEVRDSENYSVDPGIAANDEVGDLADGVRAMLQGLRERDRRIAEHVAGLESTVAERTAELSEAKAVAEAANLAKSDFLAVMSHEIRTPLNGILALSDLLNRADLPEKPRRYAEVIANSGKALISIINDILDFSKVEAGKLELESVEFDLAEIATDVASLFAGRAAEKDLELAVFVDPSLGTVTGDPTRLRQVLGNLTNNAIKFTETGGVTLRVERARHRSDGIAFSVEDTGPGIAPEKLPGLFEAFSQADQSTTRKHGGTGLGLAICDRLVRAMGGEWALSSQEGQGSSFGFLIPSPHLVEEAKLPQFAEDWSVSLVGNADLTCVVIADYLKPLGVPIVKMGEAKACIFADRVEGIRVTTPTGEPLWTLVAPFRRDDLIGGLHRLSEGLPAEISGTSRSGLKGRRFPGARVLVVDDSEVNREVAAEALNQFGVSTSFAVDGVQAVEALRRQTFDLVLMDGSMPRLDGFQAAALIRKEEVEGARGRTPILALTAHVIGTAADAWRAAGMEGVIHKPFTLGDIEAALERFCADFAIDDEDSSEAASTVAGADETLFDPAIRADLDRMAASGRQDFVTRVQALYGDNAPLRLAELRAASEAGQFDAAARAAHALKSMSLSLGARAVAEAASALEAAARSGICSPQSVADLGDRLDRTLTAMGALTSEIAFEPAIVTAIRNGELDLVFQPMMNRSGAFAGKAEALVRWTSPSGQHYSPADFVPRLEAEGSIRHLTDFVLERALILGNARPDVKISVNASAGEFQETDFADRVAAALARTKFPAARLEIEITETAILDAEAAQPTLDQLARLGVGVALDDFGAGYTSLHSLRELRFSTLKIDRSFVDRCLDDTASAAIIHAVIAVGRSLGMQVVCEGVETEAQARFLRTAGVHMIQGYVYRRPAPFKDLPEAAVAA